MHLRTQLRYHRFERPNSLHCFITLSTG